MVCAHGCYSLFMLCMRLCDALAYVIMDLSLSVVLFAICCSLISLHGFILHISHTCEVSFCMSLLYTLSHYLFSAKLALIEYLDHFAPHM